MARDLTNGLKLHMPIRAWMDSTGCRMTGRGEGLGGHGWEDLGPRLLCVSIKCLVHLHGTSVQQGSGLA